MLVMKFGGTSVGSAVAIERVSKIVRSRLERRPAVVASATAKTTDELVAFSAAVEKRDFAKAESIKDWVIEKHRRIISELDLKGNGALEETLVNGAAILANVLSENQNVEGKLAGHWTDQALSVGEFLSCNILTEALKRDGIDAVWVDARQVMVTDSNFGKAAPSLIKSQPFARGKVVTHMEEGRVPILQGFIGADEMGRTTTFGRGGSDYSATFLGSLVGAREVEIWTDVDGVLTADPTLVPHAKRIREMTFREAAELAYFGAKVLHPATILPAIDKGIPVRVLNSMRPSEDGTKIIAGAARRRDEPIVKSIAYKEGLSTVNIRSTRMLMAYGFMSSIFEVFNHFSTSVDLVATSEVSVSVTVDNCDRLKEIERELSRFAEVEVRHGRAVVCCVGENLCRLPGIPSQIFSELQDIEINLISQGASEVNISFVIDENDLPTVVDRLHKRFFSGPLDQSLFAD